MAPQTSYDRVAIVGVGLIGGSIGLALRERQLAAEVVGIGRRQKSLDTAQQVGAVDRVTVELSAGVAGADVVIVCTPVARVADIVCEVAAHCPAGARITDGASTKAHIVQEVQRRLAQQSPSDHGAGFVGSHPLAGDHRTGPEHARADLFTNRTVVVTPTPQTDPAAVGDIQQFWRQLGATIVTISPELHDEQVAAISHLPHLVAAVLAAATPSSAHHLAASGWRDTTRVAAGDPSMWRQIFDTNRQSLLQALDRFEAELSQFRASLDEGDSDQLQHLLEVAKRTRDALGN